MNPFKFICGVVVAFVGLAAFTTADAAVGTTCLCRSEDGKSFVERTLRHHRWACDFKLGYAKETDGDKQKRPPGQTCNGEEITQFKVWICLESQCTYAYARSISAKNRGLEKIEPMKGDRHP